MMEVMRSAMAWVLLVVPRGQGYIQGFPHFVRQGHLDGLGGARGEDSAVGGLPPLKHGA